jgi:hypothetical protein
MRVHVIISFILWTLQGLYAIIQQKPYTWQFFDRAHNVPVVNSIASRQQGHTTIHYPPLAFPPKPLYRIAYQLIDCFREHKLAANSAGNRML